MSASKWRSLLDQEKGKRDRVLSEIKETKKEIRQLNRRTTHLDEARALIIEVAKQTQEQLEYHIGEVVSLALGAVFEHPYEFELEFTEKRGKTEAQLWLTGDGERYEPIFSTGGGVIDICSFALRVALWSLRKPRSRNVLVLDEPFRFLSRSLQPLASMMLKELSSNLNLQIIMVSHSEDLIEGADRVFQVRKRGGKSLVKEGS